MTDAHFLQERSYRRYSRNSAPEHRMVTQQKGLVEIQNHADPMIEYKICA